MLNSVSGFNQTQTNFGNSKFFRKAVKGLTQEGIPRTQAKFYLKTITKEAEPLEKVGTFKRLLDTLMPAKGRKANEKTKLLAKIEKFPKTKTHIQTNLKAMYNIFLSESRSNLA